MTYRYRHIPLYAPDADERAAPVGWALVDAADAARIGAARWTLRADGYPQARFEGVPTLMHRAVVGDAGGLVDHADCDKLNNTRANLRDCTQLENSRNRQRQMSASGLKGVQPHGSKWRAKITVAGEQIHLGTFLTREAAGEAYDAAARTYFGEFARTNE